MFVEEKKFGEAPVEIPALPLLKEPVLDEIGKALLRAADALDLYGWCKEEMTNIQGNVCLLGSLHLGLWNSVELQLDMDQIEEVDSVAYHLGNYIGYERMGIPCHFSIPDWNDNHCKTADEAAEVLRAAAYWKLPTP